MKKFWCFWYVTRVWFWKLSPDLVYHLLFCSLQTRAIQMLKFIREDLRERRMDIFHLVWMGFTEGCPGSPNVPQSPNTHPELWSREDPHSPVNKSGLFPLPNYLSPLPRSFALLDPSVIRSSVRLFLNVSNDPSNYLLPQRKYVEVKWEKDIRKFSLSSLVVCPIKLLWMLN